MERDGRIELPTLDWKSKVMPFYESRLKNVLMKRVGKFQFIDQANTAMLVLASYRRPLRASTNLAVCGGIEPP
jgi:hypothetical protein